MHEPMLCLSLATHEPMLGLRRRRFSFSVKMNTQDLTSLVVASQLATGAFVLVQMTTQDFDMAKPWPRHGQAISEPWPSAMAKP